MHTIQREYEFAAAHRLEDHPKCGRLHGHNYLVVVQLGSLFTDQRGMVIDFGDLDKIVKPIVEELDHRYLISEDNRAAHDPYAALAIAKAHGIDLPIYATTAENLSKYLHGRIAKALNLESVSGLEVTVWETRKSAATFTAD